MPFFNEGDEPIITVESLLVNTPPGAVKLIAVDDHSDTDEESRFARFAEVEYLRTPHRMGVDYARTQGAYRADTQFVMFIDAHMRFYPGWHPAFLQALEAEPRTLVFARTEGWAFDQDGVAKLSDEKPRSLPYLDIDFAAGRCNVEWSRLPIYEETVETTCCRGATYALTLDFFRAMRGLEGLRRLGHSEEHLSLKCLALGGRIVYLNHVCIGHVYKTVDPRYASAVTYKYLYHNQMFTALALFDEPMAQTYIDNLGHDAGREDDRREALEMLAQSREVAASIRDHLLGMGRMSTPELVAKIEDLNRRNGIVRREG